jgi:putative Holliday junction resolvase
VALSDPEGIIASPYSVIERKSDVQTAEALSSLVTEQGVERIVVGLPVSLNGSAGKQARSVRQFIESLTAVLKVPVLEWDERLTTVAAERALSESKTKRGKKRERRDMIAAVYILQGYLDWYKNSGKPQL